MQIRALMTSIRDALERANLDVALFTCGDYCGRATGHARNFPSNCLVNVILMTDNVLSLSRNSRTVATFGGKTWLKKMRIQRTIYHRVDSPRCHECVTMSRSRSVVSHDYESRVSHAPPVGYLFAIILNLRGPYCEI